MESNEQERCNSAMTHEDEVVRGRGVSAQEGALGAHSAPPDAQFNDSEIDEGNIAAPQQGQDEYAGTHGVRVYFSVYTANNGYNWSSIPEGNERADLDWFYQKAVAYKPDFMVPGDVVMGVFAYNGTVAAFRIQIVPEWDCYRRSAEYCAFGFIPVDDARHINFEELLERKEFVEPTHEPPEWIEYTGSASKDIDADESMEEIKRLYCGEKLTGFDFGKIGAVLSAYGNKCRTWLFSRVDCALDHATSVLTEEWRVNPYPPPPPPPPPPVPPRTQVIRDEIQVPRPRQSRTPTTSSVVTRSYNYRKPRQEEYSQFGKRPRAMRPVTESELKSAAKLMGKRSWKDWSGEDIVGCILLIVAVVAIIVTVVFAVKLLHLK